MALRLGKLGKFKVGGVQYFYGLTSIDGRYLVGVRPSSYSRHQLVCGDCVLVNQETDEILFRNRVASCQAAVVTAAGLVVCCDNGVGETKEPVLRAFGTNGSQLWTKPLLHEVDSMQILADSRTLAVFSAEPSGVLMLEADTGNALSPAQVRALGKFAERLQTVQ